jgi:hypothetical protein
MRLKRIVAAVATGACLGAGTLAVAAPPASADIAVCEFMQYGATLGCARVPGPTPPNGGVAVGAGNEVVPTAPGTTPDTSSTYVCVYQANQGPTCQSQTLGVPVIVSVAAGVI